MNFLCASELSKKELAAQLGKSKPTRYLNDLVKKMLEMNLIEYTIPDKPNSRLQKYRLTNQGAAYLKNQGEK